MADKDDRVDENVEGSFYVDSTCIDCDACRDVAPGFFKRGNDNGYSYVYNQPTTAEERELCMAALEDCPVEAIGDDGE